MIYPLGEFTGAQLACREAAHAGDVLGFVVEEESWALRYVQVRLAGDPVGVVRLLPSAAFPPALRFDGTLAACLTAAELGRGLILDGPCEELRRDDEQALHDGLHWMPYWTPSTRAGVLHDVARALGAPLTCAGEPFGTVSDLIVDTTQWRVSALVIDTRPGEPCLHLPVAFIRSADLGLEPGFDSDVRAAALACAPAWEPAVPEADYLDRVRHHLTGD